MRTIFFSTPISKQAGTETIFLTLNTPCQFGEMAME